MHSKEINGEATMTADDLAELDRRIADIDNSGFCKKKYMYKKSMTNVLDYMESTSEMASSAESVLVYIT